MKKSSPSLLILPLLFLLPSTIHSISYPNTVPSTTTKTNNNNACRLDLSNELFGGVADACAHSLDHSRCCPVLAAWLYAAHARDALNLNSTPTTSPSLAAISPLMPDDNQKCVVSLQSALGRRGIALPRANETCDAVMCFCGIRLHQIGSLRCPAAFNVGERNVTPTAAVTRLERDCRNASFAGCSRCLRSLDKLKGHAVTGVKSSSSSNIARTNMMFGRDCELMGLTWLLAKNKTAYIPAVSAVLRAILYSDGAAGKCSADQENMPLAVDSLQIHRHQSSASSFCSFFSFVFWYFAIFIFSLHYGLLV